MGTVAMVFGIALLISTVNFFLDVWRDTCHQYRYQRGGMKVIDRKERQIGGACAYSAIITLLVYLMIQAPWVWFVPSLSAAYAYYGIGKTIAETW